MNKRKLYESIMRSVAKQVKRAINEEYEEEYDDLFFKENGIDIEDPVLRNTKMRRYEVPGKKMESLYIDVTDLLDENPTYYQEDVDLLLNDLNDMFDNITVSDIIEGKASCPYIRITCLVEDINAIKAFLRENGYKVLNIRSSYKKGVRKRF